ncbi:hypothetical protein ACFXPS_25660 [Nocardia sp. NPDC059091]|uniref:hypothetical protein n=1 Tax=unclassified Nocardia TaxID=2637762 RepID=UPI00368317C4
MTTLAGSEAVPEAYRYDAHGNTTHLRRVTGALIEPDLHWDYGNSLYRFELGGGSSAHYVCDATGQRVRKVWEPGLTEERIYSGGFASAPLTPSNLTPLDYP